MKSRTFCRQLIRLRLAGPLWQIRRPGKRSTSNSSPFCSRETPKKLYQVRPHK
jgi:hypothetical protein